MTKPIEDLPNLSLEMDGETLVATCMECTFYFEHAPVGPVKEFATRALEALDGELTHYVTGSMKRFAPRGKKSEGAVTSMFARPRVGASNWIQFRAAGFGEGVSAAEFTVLFRLPPPPPSTPADIAAAVERNREMYEDGSAIFMPHVSTVRAAFPLDHPLAQPGALLDWVRDLDCVRTPCFVSGHAGFALNAAVETGAREHRKYMQSALGAALARHPGLGWEHSGSITRKLLKYWPGHPGFLPRFKRVQWLTFVRNLMLDELCGGRDAVVAQINGRDGIVCHDLGDGLMIQAGDEPGIGDVTRGMDLPAYRAVARVLAPARLPEHRGVGKTFTHDAAQAWLTALERDDA